MENIGRLLIVVGIFSLVVGGIILLGARSGLFAKIPLGRLPGDFTYRSGPLTCIFPLATMIILSVVLTIALNIIVRLIK
jgi:hypothetical protein